MDVGEWVDDTRGVEHLARAIGTGPLAFDLEADSSHRYRERVCLVQLAWHAHQVLVDPLGGASLEPLRGVLGDPRVRKVLHGADYDLRLLHREHALEIHGLFDTMVAARLVGETSFGLASLVERLLGAHVDKSHQRADWAIRPLPPAMRAYAVDDTRHLLALAQVLEERLRRAGRMAWAQEEFLRLEGVRWRADTDESSTLRKLRGAALLDRRGLAIARELHSVRDRQARSRDVPPFRVLRDEVLCAIARARPTSAADIARLPGLPRALAHGPGAREVLAAVARGLAVPEGELPALARVARPRVTAEHEARVRRLVAARDALARELSLDRSVLAPRGLLERLASAVEAGADPRSVPDLRAWQADLLGSAIDALRS